MDTVLTAAVVAAVAAAGKQGERTLKHAYINRQAADCSVEPTALLDARCALNELHIRPAQT